MLIANNNDDNCRTRFLDLTDVFTTLQHWQIHVIIIVNNNNPPIRIVNAAKNIIDWKQKSPKSNSLIHVIFYH